MYNISKNLKYAVFKYVCNLVIGIYYIKNCNYETFHKNIK